MDGRESIGAMGDAPWARSSEHSGRALAVSGWPSIGKALPIINRSAILRNQGGLRASRHVQSIPLHTEAYLGQSAQSNLSHLDKVLHTASGV